MNNIIKHPEFKYGVIIGLEVSAYIYIEYLLGLHTTYTNIGRYTGIFSTLIPIFGLYYAIRTKRIQKPDQTISFKSAFVTGFITATIAGAIISGFFYLYNTTINPGWMSKAIKEETTYLKKQNKKENEINEQINLMKQAYEPKNQLSTIFAGTVMNGTILSIIIAAVASKKKVTPKEPEIKELETVEQK